MIFKPISMILAEPLLATDNYLPLSKNDMANLLLLVPEEEEIFLTIRDNLYTEWVRAKNQCGTILISRGEGGSTPRKFPRGSCVYFETSLPVVQWLICNYDCCTEGSCTCQAVTLDKKVIPIAITGEFWEGRIMFDGSWPMKFAVTNVPDWVRIEFDEVMVRFSGIPPAAGKYSISISATNCLGSAIIVESYDIIVLDPPSSISK